VACFCLFVFRSLGEEGNREAGNGKGFGFGMDSERRGRVVIEGGVDNVVLTEVDTGIGGLLKGGKSIVDADCTLVGIFASHIFFFYSLFFFFLFL